MKTALEELESCLQQLCSTPMGRRAFLASVPVLMASCATSSSSRKREGDNSGQETRISVEDERKMTQKVLPEMRKDYPTIQDPRLQTYIRKLGGKITQDNQLEGHPYHYQFTVVGAKFVNAFALPAGTVFVTAPLIQMADSEAELAGVVGHEIGHIKARHTAERMDKAEREQKKSLGYLLGGGLLGGAMGFGLGKLLCPPKDNECLARATAVGAAAGVGGGLLIQKYQFMANSREDEMEADRIGFRTSVATGYHKDYVGRFYSKLLVMEQEHKKGDPVLASIADAMSTHPPSQERVDQMKEMASDEKQSGGKVSSPEFENVKQICKDWMQAQGLKTT